MGDMLGGFVGGVGAYLEAENQRASNEQYRQQHQTAQFNRRAQTRIEWTPPDKRTTAAALLGVVSTTATPDEIRAAFTTKVKELHPDAGGTGGDIAELKAARDLLLTTEPKKEALNQDLTCPLCQGSGMVPSGFGSAPCASCGGTGNAL